MEDDMPVYGIDLGTTNSCIARMTDSSNAEVLPNLDGMMTMPSVVYFRGPSSEPIVGLQAKRVAVAMPDLVCMLIKRRMGLEANDDGQIVFHGTTYTPELISAIILRKVIDDALEYGCRPRGSRIKAVITVPAYFGSVAKNATKNAGLLADVEVIDLLQEPVAAAIAYGFGRVSSPQNLLVYDLGGGTFDVTVVRSDGGSTHTIATDGVRLLGGHDWDTDIVDWVKQEYEEAHPGKELPVEEDLELKHRLYEEAEQAKKALSVREKTVLTVHYEGESFAQELTRVEFEEITAHLLEQTLDKTEAVIEAAKQKGVEKIDKLLLVGGSSRMPAVERGLRGLSVLEGVDASLRDPDLAICKGAAQVADWILRGKLSVDMTGHDAAVSGEGRLVTMVNSKSVGFIVRDFATGEHFVDYVIRRNTELPARARKTYYTREDNQQSLAVSVVEEREEESKNIEENTILHEESFEGLPPNLPEGSPLEHTLSLDGVGILHIFVREPESGKTFELKVSRYKALTDDELLRLKPMVISSR